MIRSCRNINLVSYHHFIRGKYIVRNGKVGYTFFGHAAIILVLDFTYKVKIVLDLTMSWLHLNFTIYCISSIV